MLPFPAGRDRVAVNAMVPRLAPDVAAALAVRSGCGTIKVKVGDDESIDRVAAIRSACGPRTHLRLDANGAWDVEAALRMLALLRTYDIELVEDPVASLEDLASLRGRVPMPVAAESSIRTTADARRLHDLEAADAIVLKPQRIGGVREALRAAEAAGVPAIASSALETSVGLAAVVALAAALPDSPFAHGAGTALLLATDVVSDPLLPVDGWLTPRRPHVDARVLTSA
jgi:O-succinylbenzoate synthase